MVKSTAANKPKDAVPTTKARTRKAPTKVSPTKLSPAKAGATKVTRAKVSSTKSAPVKSAVKETATHVQKEATKSARRAGPKANGQAARLKAIRTKQTKAQIMQTITEETGLPRKDVIKVMASLATLAKRHVMKRGSGEFSIPELGVKVRRVQRKARMARNPMTGEPVRVPAKTAVKATVLKALKDAVL